MANPFKLLVLPGDGIGPEVVAAALRVFESLCLREELETYACLRPARAYQALPEQTPFKTEVVSGADTLAQHIEDALEQCLHAGSLTADLGGNASTEQVCEKILSALD